MSSIRCSGDWGCCSSTVPYTSRPCSAVFKKFENIRQLYQGHKQCAMRMKFDHRREKFRRCQSGNYLMINAITLITLNKVLKYYVSIQLATISRLLLASNRKHSAICQHRVQLYREFAYIDNFLSPRAFCSFVVTVAVIYSNRQLLFFSLQGVIPLTILRKVLYVRVACIWEKFRRKGGRFQLKQSHWRTLSDCWPI